jgi:tetratricopeptide (TPR) repeat protein
MADYGRIRRNRSALGNGLIFGQKRRGISLWFLLFWLVSMGVVALVVWQFNDIQPRVLAMVGSPATPTPSMVEYARLGDRAFWSGDLDGAVDHYRTAAQLMPDDVNVLYELARVLIYRSYGDIRNLGDIAEAERWAEQAIRIAPNSARAQTIHCFALVRAGKSSDAVRACLRAIDLNPSDAEPHAYLSMASFDLGRTSTALEEARSAVELNPNSIDANSAYARALAFQGEFSAAMGHFENAIAVNPNLEFPYFELAFFAYTLANRNNGDERQYRIAISAYSAVLERSPQSVKAYTRLCQTYLAMGEPRDAAGYCQQAIEIDPEYAPGWRWLGEVYHKSRNYEDAVESLKTCSDLETAQGVPVDARDSTCWWLRGVGYFILGDCERAMPILEDVLTWATDEIAIRETNRAIDKCATAYQGMYVTPTPIPTATPRPTPIL